MICNVFTSSVSLLGVLKEKIDIGRNEVEINM
mgnify:CR=1 FL=1